MKIPDPTFWPVTDRITAIQTHTAQDANLLKRKLEARRVAYSVRGAPLEVFHVNRSLERQTQLLTDLLPNAHEVYGGDASELLKRPTTA